MENNDHCFFGVGETAHEQSVSRLETDFEMLSRINHSPTRH
jgi:hypothetical protein